MSFLEEGASLDNSSGFRKTPSHIQQGNYLSSFPIVKFLSLEDVELTAPS